MGTPVENRGEVAETSRIRRRATVVILLLASTLGVMAGAIVVPVLEVIRGDLGVGGTAAGFIITAHGLAIAISSPIVGRLIDRWGVRLPLATGLVVYGIGGGAGVLADSFPWLIASRLLLGLGAAAVFSGTTVTLLSLYQDGQRDRMLGWRTTATTAGGFIWPLLAGVLGNLTWHAAFTIYLVGIPLGLATLLTLPTARPEPAQGKRIGAVALLRTYPILLLWYALMLSIGLAMYSVAVFLPQRLAQIGVNEPFLVSWYQAVSAIASAIVGFTYARIRARSSYPTLLRIAMACWATGFVILGTVTQFPLVLCCGAVFGLANGLLMPVVTVLIGDTPPPQLRGQATSLSGTAVFIGQFISPLVFGPLMQATSITTGYLLAAGLCTLVLIGLIRLRIPTTEQTAAEV